MVKIITIKEEFDDELQRAGSKTVVVDFSAEWCGPCRQIKPVFHRAERDNPDMVFLQVDVDDGSEIAEKYKITAMPTFIFFKNMAQVDFLRGANAEKLEQMIAKYK